MTIEQFLRGCFDCGYEAAIVLQPTGVWRISVYKGGDIYEARYKCAEAMTFEAALVAFEAEPWGVSTKEFIAATIKAQSLGGWSAEGTE